MVPKMRIRIDKHKNILPNELVARKEKAEDALTLASKEYLEAGKTSSEADGKREKKEKELEDAIASNTPQEEIAIIRAQQFKSKMKV
jgi:hypothetical protein